MQSFFITINAAQPELGRIRYVLVLFTRVGSLNGQTYAHRIRRRLDLSLDTMQQDLRKGYPGGAGGS